jgi:hypothetical protein
MAIHTLAWWVEAGAEHNRGRSGQRRPIHHGMYGQKKSIAVITLSSGHCCLISTVYVKSHIRFNIDTLSLEPLQGSIVSVAGLLQGSTAVANAHILQQLHLQRTLTQNQSYHGLPSSACSSSSSSSSTYIAV